MQQYSPKVRCFDGVHGQVCWVHTDRVGGVSKPPFDALNLGAHVGDQASDVASNRRIMADQLGLANDIVWLNQIHGTDIVHLDVASTFVRGPEADGAYTQSPMTPCAIMTADCLSILVFSEEGDEVGAVHAGWRGLAGGILARLLERFESAHLCASLGPTLCQQHFEVDANVEQAFVAHMGEQARDAFIDSPNSGKRLGDLYHLACMQLSQLEVQLVDEAPLPCSYCDEQRYFSYRRDGKTGRQASIIWLNAT